MIRYLQLLKPPSRRPLDAAIYLVLCLATAILTLPASLLSRRAVRPAARIVFTSLMPKDLVIDFMGVRFLARKGKTDILLLNPLSSPEVWRYFRPQPGDVVVDVGAHVGKYALVAARSVGEHGKVVAIEAHPDNFRALLHNVSLNNMRNVIPLNAAAYSDDDRTMRLFGRWDSAYTLKSWSKTAVRVQTSTVDSLLRRHGILAADWAKIDVEGAEADVLAGMRQVIENSPGLRVIVEVSPSTEAHVDGLLSGFDKESINKLDVFYRRRLG